MGAARRAVDYRDLLALPEHVVGEIVGGELEVSPRPRSRHARAAVRLDRWMDGFDTDEDDGDDDGEGPEGWWILFEPEVHVGGDILVPDLAGWRRDRMPVLEDTAWFDLAPDWVCEVLSPSTARLDRTRKLPLYGQAGVAYAWLVDVDAECLEAYRREGAFWVLLGAWGGDEVARIAPFEARELKLSRLWMPKPRSAATAGGAVPAGAVPEEAVASPAAVQQETAMEARPSGTPEGAGE